MTKVVFQNGAYWLDPAFWKEALESGIQPFRVEVRNGAVSIRPITLDEFAKLCPARVAGWSYSATKSVSVLLRSLSPEERAKMVRGFQKAIQTGLELVAGRFSARTGAQGKVRLDAEANFTVVIHVEAKNGEPQLHAHIAIDPRVRVLGQTDTYATHTRELYQLRKLFHTAVNAEFSFQLRNELGVFTQTVKNAVQIPDVPKSLCQMSSSRTHQIDAYILKNNLKNTPIVRRYAALVTRRDIAGPFDGREAFRAALQNSGFLGESICHRPQLLVTCNPDSLQRARISIARCARQLSQSLSRFSESELLIRVYERFSGRFPVSSLTDVTKQLLRSPSEIGLRAEVSPHGQTVYSSAHPLKKWKQIAERIDFVFAEKESTLGQPPPKQHSSDGGFAGSAKRNNAEQVKPEQPEDTSSPKPDGGRKFEKIFRAYQFIGAVGQLGLQVVAKAEELYRIWAKPIWRVHGHGSKNTPGSVAAMVRDLKKLSRYESHQTALQAMLKLNGTLNEKLRYGESVYRRCRKPKFRVPKRSLIIVRDVGQANPKDVRFLMAKVARARAKILFVEQDWPRSVVVKQAQAMRPGEGRHFQSPEQKP